MAFRSRRWAPLVATRTTGAFKQGRQREQCCAQAVTALAHAQITDQVLMASVGQLDTYCLRATGSAVTVTLAWADYPCDLSAAICLARSVHRSQIRLRPCV